MFYFYFNHLDLIWDLLTFPSSQNHLFIMGSELALSGRIRNLLHGEITQREVDGLSRFSIEFETSFKPNPGGNHYIQPRVNRLFLKKGGEGEKFLKN